MAIAQYVSTGGAVRDAGGGAGATSIAVPYPSGIQADDLLVLHVAFDGTVATWTTPSGWTQIGSQRNGAAAYYKLATGSETGTLSVTISTTQQLVGAMLRFNQVNTSAPVNVSNSAASLTVSTITPTLTNTLWVYLGGTQANTSLSFSTYAMATNDPSPWTEVYDTNYAGGGGSSAAIAAAYSALRTATSASGNISSAATAGSSNSGFAFAINSAPNASVVADVQTVTTSIFDAVTVTGTAVYNAAVQVLSAVINAATASTPAPKWTNDDKNDAAWTNEPKS